MPRVMFPPVPRGVPSESIHSKVTVPTDDTAQSATVTVQVRVSMSPTMVMPGGLMEAERAGTVESERGKVMLDSDSTIRYMHHTECHTML